MRAPEPLEIVERRLPDFEQRETLACAAAQLIVEHVYPGQSMLYYLYRRQWNEVHYLLVADNTSLIAAACVRHGRPEGTYIASIATQPAWRGNGYGTQLLGHIATQAIAKGDPIVGAIPKHPEHTFFTRLGFGDLEAIGYAHAEPEAVLHHIARYT